MNITNIVVCSLIIIFSSNAILAQNSPERRVTGSSKATGGNTESASANGVSFVNAAGDTLMQVRDDGNVIIGAAVANGNAVLDIDALNNDKGILIPRLTTAQRSAIAGLSAADNGLAVYDETSASFWYWNSSQWVEIGSGGADNLGNHTATQALNLNGNDISGADTVTATAFIGDGSALTGIDADSTNELQTLSLNGDTLIISDGNSVTLPAGSDTSGWDLSGNSGTDTTTNFIGTTDDMPLDFKVNNKRALRLVYAMDSSGDTSPNIIGGYDGNSVSANPELIGATIAGGGVAGSKNRVTEAFGTVSGGYGNSVSGYGATVGGGVNNSAAGDFSYAAGRKAKANHQGAFVWADNRFEDFNSTANNEFSARARGGVRFVTATDGSGNPTAGVKLAAGDSMWTTLNGNPIGSGSDNLGDHTATQSLNLNGNYLSGDGDGEGIFVDSSGNVGIGIESPEEKLHIQDGKLIISHGFASPALFFLDRADFSDWSIQHQRFFDRLDFRRIGSTVMSLEWTGRVGIGTVTPFEKLHVSEGRIQISHSSTSPALLFVDGADSSDWSIHYERNTDRMLFRHNGNNTKMAIDAGGTVTATAFVGDGSGLTGISGSDNLGDHTATQALNLNGNDISGADTVTATTFIGDGSGLTGISGDDLGDHTATQALNLNGNYLSGDGGAEGVFVDNDGNAGIGTTTPSERLEVAGSARLTANNPQLVFYDNAETSIRQAMITTSLNGALIIPGPTAADQKMSFHVDNTIGLTRVMTLQGDGNVGIGTSNPDRPVTIISPGSWSGFVDGADMRLEGSNPLGAGLSLKSTDTGGKMYTLLSTGSGSNIGAGGFGIWHHSAGYRLAIDATGNVGIGTANPGYRLQVGSNGDGSQARANAWNTFSDRRWKRDFKSIPNPLAKLNSLNGYYYYWKAEAKDQTRQLGVIAQEVESVLPEIVSADAEGYKSVDYSKLSAYLIEVNKAQQAEIELQQKKIEALRSEVSELRSLKTKITQIEKALQKLNSGSAQSEMASNK